MKKKNIIISDASIEKLNTTKETDSKNEAFEKKTLEGLEKAGSTKTNLKTKKPFKEKFKSITRTQKIIVLLVLIAIPGVIFTVYLFLSIIKKPSTPLDIISIKGNYLQTNNKKIDSKISVLNQPSQPRTEENPINGTLYTKAEMSELKQHRPVAVMVNNHNAARPQSNLSKADIVYEALAEGGITRYLAIYWSHGQDANKVGPIRSARQYYIEWLNPYDPLFVHDGYASTSDPRTNAGGSIYSYEIKAIATLGAWRVDDRYAPHNEYSSVPKAWEYGDQEGWGGYTEIQSLKFKNDAPIKDRGTKTKVHMSYWGELSNGGLFDAQWEYNPETNSYLRWIGGEPDIDLETGQQISAKTVIIQRVSMEPAYDEHAHIIITTIGEGDATILQDGKVIPAKWKKPSRTDRDKYYDLEGNELALNRGLIWVAAVPADQGQFDIIEQ